MTTFNPSTGSSDSLLVDIVETLEERGLGRDEYRLHDFVDPDALQRLMASSSSVTVTVDISGIRLQISQDGVTAQN